MQCRLSVFIQRSSRLSHYILDEVCELRLFSIVVKRNHAVPHRYHVIHIFVRSIARLEGDCVRI